jgi:hypothetical protein
LLNRIYTCCTIIIPEDEKPKGKTPGSLSIIIIQGNTVRKILKIFKQNIYPAYLQQENNTLKDPTLKVTGLHQIKIRNQGKLDSRHCL